MREMERLRDRFKRRYPTLEEQTQIRIEVQAENVATTSSLAGYKLTAANASDIVMLKENSVASSRLAPYEGWESFIGTARDNFETATKIIGRREVARIGAGFVNRLDIPSSTIEGRDIAAFVKTVIAIPEQVANTVGPYSLAVNFVEKSTGAKILFQSGVVIPPPLLDHVSITLDIDAFLDSGISNHKDAIWESATVLRNAKNTVFECTITDELRALFG